MKKHKFNIFPEAKAEDYNRLLEDIKSNGYDKTQPITIYEGEIIDGWNRQRACDEIGIKPEYVTFTGTDGEAIALVMRTNKRRNLNSGQWACIAAEADDLLAVIADEAAKNVGGRPKQRQEPEPVEPQQKIVAVSSNRNVTDTRSPAVRVRPERSAFARKVLMVLMRKTQECRYPRSGSRPRGFPSFCKKVWLL